MKDAGVEQKKVDIYKAALESRIEKVKTKEKLTQKELEPLVL